MPACALPPVGAPAAYSPSLDNFLRIVHLTFNPSIAGGSHLEAPFHRQDGRQPFRRQTAIAFSNAKSTTICQFFFQIQIHQTRILLSPIWASELDWIWCPQTGCRLPCPNPLPCHPFLALPPGALGLADCIAAASVTVHFFFQIPTIFLTKSSTIAAASPTNGSRSPRT